MHSKAEDLQGGRQLLWALWVLLPPLQDECRSLRSILQAVLPPPHILTAWLCPASPSLSLPLGKALPML